MKSEQRQNDSVLEYPRLSDSSNLPSKTSDIIRDTVLDASS